MHAMHSKSWGVPNDAYQEHNPYKIHQVEVP